MRIIRGYKVQVIKGKYESTNGGITSLNEELVLVIDGVRGDTEIDENEPHLLLVHRFLFGSDVYHAAPSVNPKGMIGPMSGGNSVKCEHVDFFMPELKVHDRFETSEQYKTLCT